MLYQGVDLLVEEDVEQVAIHGLAEFAQDLDLGVLGYVGSVGNHVVVGAFEVEIDEAHTLIPAKYLR